MSTVLRVPPVIMHCPKVLLVKVYIYSVVQSLILPHLLFVILFSIKKLEFSVKMIQPYRAICSPSGCHTNIHLRSFISEFQIHPFFMHVRFIIECILERTCRHSAELYQCPVIDIVQPLSVNCQGHGALVTVAQLYEVQSAYCH